MVQLLTSKLLTIKKWTGWDNDRSSRCNKRLWRDCCSNCSLSLSLAFYAWYTSSRKRISSIQQLWWPENYNHERQKGEIQKLQSGKKTTIFERNEKEMVNEKRKLVYEIHAESMKLKLCAWFLVLCFFLTIRFIPIFFSSNTVIWCDKVHKFAAGHCST